MTLQTRGVLHTTCEVLIVSESFHTIFIICSCFLSMHFVIKSCTIVHIAVEFGLKYRITKRNSAHICELALVPPLYKQNSNARTRIHATQRVNA